MSLALLVIAAVVGVVFYLKWMNGYWKRRGIYQTDPELFFGNSRRFMLGKISLAETILIRYNSFKEANVKHGGFYIFAQPTFMSVDPGTIKAILQKDFQYFQNRGLYHAPGDVLSMNLLNIEDDSWKRLRAKLTPTFTSGKMKIMFETLVEKTEGLEKIIGEHADSKEACDIKDVLGRFTTDIIGSCAFGIECNSLQNPDNVFRQYGKKVFQPKKLNLLLRTIIPWKVLSYFNFKESGEDVTNFFTDLVKNTIKYREEHNIYRKDFMHLLLQLKNAGSIHEHEKIGHTHKHGSNGGSITEDEIVAQCFIFFVAGFETSSTAMTFALFELAENSSVQNKLRNEIEAVLKKYDGKMTYDAVLEMHYLDKVVNETLRKWPPIVATVRVCNKNYNLQGTDLVIEAGTRVNIPVIGLHKDPDYYPNPDVFNPENFSDESKATRPDFTFLPFGEGPRMCIGLRFGVMQTKVGLISLIRNFNFTLNQKTKLPLEMEKSTFVMSVKDGIWLNARRL